MTALRKARLAAIQELHADGLLNRELAEALGVSISVIENDLHVLRLKANKKGYMQFTPECFSCPLPDCKWDAIRLCPVKEEEYGKN